MKFWFFSIFWKSCEINKKKNSQKWHLSALMSNRLIFLLFNQVMKPRNTNKNALNRRSGQLRFFIFSKQGSYMNFLLNYPLQKLQIYTYCRHHRAKMRGRWNNFELVCDACMLLPKWLWVCLCVCLFILEMFANKWINLIRVASLFIGVKFWAIPFQTNKQTLGQKHTCITYNSQLFHLPLILVL